MKRDVMAEISRVFKPEFIGRLDEIIVFHKLTDENMKMIVDIELSKVRERLRERGIRVDLAEEAKEFVISKSRGEGEREHTDYGARPLRRAVEMYIEDPLSEELLRGQFEGKNVIRITVKTVGEEQQLDFTGAYEEGADTAEVPALAAVGAEEGESESQG